MWDEDDEVSVEQAMNRPMLITWMPFWSLLMAADMNSAAG